MTDRNAYTPTVNLEPVESPADGFELVLIDGLDPVLAPPESGGGGRPVREIPKLVRVKA